MVEALPTNSNAARPLGETSDGCTV